MISPQFKRKYIEKGKYHTYVFQQNAVLEKVPECDNLMKVIHFDQINRPVRKISVDVSRKLGNLTFYDSEDNVIDNYNPFNRSRKIVNPKKDRLYKV